jgi:pimeloyl-ACP methyl ester carboxylesterase
VNRPALRSGAVVLAATALLGFADAASASLLPLPTTSLSTDAFYTPPSPLPPGKPGDVIRTQNVVVSAYPNAAVKRIMYLSTDTRGNLVPVTGMLLTPLLHGPGVANPLVVHTPGTRGLDDACAPSRQTDLLTANPGSPDYESPEYEEFLLRGISVVVTDYEGAGTPGDPSYLVGPSEGRNGLDALRAAEQIGGVGLSPNSPVGITGYSQGGQGAGWTAELQPSYAPELHLKGVLAGGVPADMLAEVNHLNGNLTAGAGFALASLVGLNHANPELDLAGRLTPEGKQVIDQVKHTCFVGDFAAFGTTTVGEVTNPDVLADPAWQHAYQASRLGTRKPGAPVFLYQGTADTIVPKAEGDSLYHDWCAQGASVQYETVLGAEHVTAQLLGSVPGIEWLAAQLGGAPGVPGCRQVSLP